MGEGDFDYDKHVRSTIYCGKGMPDGGKRKGKNEMGEGDFDHDKHVRSTIYCGKGMPDGGKRMGKNEMGTKRMGKNEMGTGEHEHARRAWVADDECKGTGKDDMASERHGARVSLQFQ